MYLVCLNDKRRQREKWDEKMLIVLLHCHNKIYNNSNKVRERRVKVV